MSKLQNSVACPLKLLWAKMADESKEQNAPVHGSSIWRNRELAYAVEETQNIDTADDFDPFSGVVECIDEHIDIQLSAPPENQ